MNSRLAEHRAPKGDRWRGHPRQELPPQATAGAVRGVRRSDGPARGSKSIAEVGKRRAAERARRRRASGNRARSSPPTRERRGVNQRRKLPRRWQNRGTVAGPRGRESDRGSTCRWKALRNAEAVPLDGDTAEAVLAPSGFPGRSRVALGAMGSVRGESAFRRAVEKTARGGHLGCPIPDEVGVVADGAEAEVATSIATFPGVGSPQGGPAPPRTWRPQADGGEAVHAAQAARVGNRTVLG